MGSILGCGMAIFEDEKKRPHAAKARLYRILITESMYLIWKLRCKCVIGRNGEPPTANEIHNRWVHTINERLEIDNNLTNELKFGKQYILPRKLVLDTWRATLHTEKDLPRDWLNKAEVLVGIASMGSRRPPSPNEGVG
jgi:ribonuclease HI